MCEETFNKIKTILEEKAVTRKTCSIHLLINYCKEKGITESQVKEVIERLQKNGDTYIISNALCLLD